MPTTDRSNTEHTRRLRSQKMANGYFPRGTPKDTSTELDRKFGDYRYFVDGALSGIYPDSQVKPPEITISLMCQGTVLPIPLEVTKQYKIANADVKYMTVLFSTGEGPASKNIEPGSASVDPPSGSTAITGVTCTDIISLVCDEAPSITPGNTYVFYNGTLAKQTTTNVTVGGSPQTITLLPGQYSAIITNVGAVGIVTCIPVLSLQCGDSPPSVNAGDDYVLKNVGNSGIDVTYTVVGNPQTTNTIYPLDTLLVENLQSIDDISCILNNPV